MSSKKESYKYLDIIKAIQMFISTPTYIIS